MENFKNSHDQSFKEQRQRRLNESLSARRKTEKCDVTLISGEKSFPAHRLILETSSPFFETMFQSELEEAKTGVVSLNNIDAETLEFVLDYIYLGEVSNIKTENQVKKVLIAAHMMLLTELFFYCVDVLLEIVSIHNFKELWELGERYDNKELINCVLAYSIAHLHEITLTNAFKMLSVGQINQLAKIYLSKYTPTDLMLEGVITWIIHDLKARENSVLQLFCYFSAKNVSKEYIVALLKDKNFMKSSLKIKFKMNQLGVEVLLAADNISAMKKHLNPSTSTFSKNNVTDIIIVTSMLSVFVALLLAKIFEFQSAVGICITLYVLLCWNFCSNNALNYVLTWWNSILDNTSQSTVLAKSQ